jgi:hypothetical protein
LPPQGEIYAIFELEKAIHGKQQQIFLLHSII